MFNISTIASNVLNSIDSAAKETLEEPKIQSAKYLRSKRKENYNNIVVNDNINVDHNKNSLVHENNNIIDNNISPSSSVDSINDSSTVDIAVKNQELKKVIRNKNQEIERLNSECLELEDVSNSLKKELSDVWKRYYTLNDKLIDTETKLLDEIKSLQLSNNDLLIVKDKYLIINRQIEQLENEKNDLVEQLTIANSNSIEGVNIIKNQLINANNTINSLTLENQIFIRQSNNRLVELENNIQLLSQLIKNKDDEIIQLTNKLNNNLTADGTSYQNNKYYDNEIDILNNHINNLQNNLSDEKEKNNLLERRVHQLELEAKASMLSIEEERNRFEKIINDQSKQIGQLEDKIKEFELKEIKSLEDINTTMITINQTDFNDLNNQIHDLTKQLLKKQGLVVELQAEKSAMKSRVQDLQTRCTSAERLVASLRNNDDDDYTIDIEESAISYLTNNTNTIRKRSNINSQDNDVDIKQNRNNSNSHILRDLEKYGVKPAPGVANAVNIVDAWTLTVFRFLRAYPLARFGLVIYLLVLHLWVFIVLALQTHSLELETDPRKAILNKTKK